jgi:hypothetical protein
MSDTRDAYTLCVGEIRMLQHKMRDVQLWHSFKIKRWVNVYSEITCLSGWIICNNMISASKWYRFFVLSMLYYIRIDDKSSPFIYCIRTVGCWLFPVLQPRYFLSVVCWSFSCTHPDCCLALFWFHCKLVLNVPPSFMLSICCMWYCLQIVACGIVSRLLHVVLSPDCCLWYCLQIVACGIVSRLLLVFRVPI